MKLLAWRRFSIGGNGTLVRCWIPKISLFLASDHEWCSFAACTYRSFGVRKQAAHSWQMTGACIVGPPSASAWSCTKCGISVDTDTDTDSDNYYNDNQFLLFSMYSFVHSFIRSFVHTSIYPTMHSFVSFTHPFIIPCIHSFIIHLFIHPFTHPCIHSFIIHT